MRASEFIKEDAAAVGKIATKKERNDPRYKTSLTVDVKPDTMKKAIAAYFPTAPLDNRQHQVHEEIRQQGVAEGLQPDSDLAVVGVKILNALKAKCEEIDRKYPHLWEKLTSDEWIGSGAAYQFVQDYIDVDKHTLKTFFSAWEDVGGDPFHDWPVFWREGQWDDFIAPWRQYAYDVLKSRGVDPKPPGNILMNGVAEGKIKLSTDPNWYGAEVGDYKASGPIVNIPANRLVGFEPDDKMNQPASKANVEKIVAGLKQGAKLPPLLVRQYKNGYQVLDGHHRFWAYKLLGVKSIPAQIVPAEDVEDTSKQGVEEGFIDTIKQTGRKVKDYFSQDDDNAPLTMNTGEWEKLDTKNWHELNPIKNDDEDVTEGRMADTDAIIQSIIAGDIDPYDIMAHPQGPEEEYVAKILEKEYEDVAIEHRLHPDDDFEQILDRVVDRLAQDYGHPMDEAENPYFVETTVAGSVAPVQGELEEGGDVFAANIQNTPEYKQGFSTGKLPVPYPEGSQEYANYYKGVIDKATPTLSKQGMAEEENDMSAKTPQDPMNYNAAITGSYYENDDPLVRLKTLALSK